MFFRRGITLFSCKKVDGYSLYQFNGKTVLKSKFCTPAYEKDILAALRMGYTIGSMDTENPIFQSTMLKMKAEVNDTIDAVNSNLFGKDSDGEK